MPAKQSIVDVTTLAGGRLIAGATNRRLNSLWQFDGNAWSGLAEWKGKEVTACCGVGNAIVCAALDGELYVWSEDQLHKHTLPDPTMWIHAATALDDTRALLGGSGGLVFFEPLSGELQHRRLSTYEISKPGRTIHGISRSDGRTFIVGAKNLVLELQGDRIVELANRASFGGHEILLLSAAYCQHRLWLSGFGDLAALDGNGVQIYENVFGNRLRGIGLQCHHGELLVFQEQIMLGDPNNWRPIISGFQAPGLIAVESLPDDQLCAVTYAGESFVLQGNSVRAVPIF
jgi:hypothetical protein